MNDAASDVTRFTGSQLGWMREAYLRTRPLAKEAAELRRKADKLQAKADSITGAAFRGVLAEHTVPENWRPVTDPSDPTGIPIGFRAVTHEPHADGGLVLPPEAVDPALPTPIPVPAAPLPVPAAPIPTPAAPAETKTLTAGPAPAGGPA